MEEIKVELKSEEEKLNCSNSKIVPVRNENDSYETKNSPVNSTEDCATSRVIKTTFLIFSSVLDKELKNLNKDLIPIIMHLIRNFARNLKTKQMKEMNLMKAKFYIKKDTSVFKNSKK